VFWTIYVIGNRISQFLRLLENSNDHKKKNTDDKSFEMAKPSRSVTNARNVEVGAKEMIHSARMYSSQFNTLIDESWFALAVYRMHLLNPNRKESRSGGAIRILSIRVAILVTYVKEKGINSLKTTCTFVHPQHFLE
jgi:hypothetical protein